MYVYFYIYIHTHIYGCVCAIMCENYPTNGRHLQNIILKGLQQD